MLPRQPLRFLLADDPGAGKTVMSGLFIKELKVRGNLDRCLIVSPGNLVEQWQDELYTKFQLEFEILTGEMLKSSVRGNVFLDKPYLIARLDKLSRDEAIQQKLKYSEWDLVICDEAHKMSATVSGGSEHRTKRYNMGMLLSSVTRHFYCLPQRPITSKKITFSFFCALLTADVLKAKTGTERKAPQPASCAGWPKKNC
jgi:SNF2 family DNA or RNA helicase